MVCRRWIPAEIASRSALSFHHSRRVQAGEQCRVLSAGALAVLTTWPTAGPTLAFFQLLLRPADAAFSGHLLLGILDPADELVAGQRCDVLPGIERDGVGDQGLAKVCRKLVYHPTKHSRAAHKATVATGRGFVDPKTRRVSNRYPGQRGPASEPTRRLIGEPTGEREQLSDFSGCAVRDS